MRPLHVVLLSGLLCGAAALPWSAASADDRKTRDEKGKDQSKLEGTWAGFVVQGRGEKPNEGPVKLQIVITAGKMAAKDLREDKDMGEGTYTLDDAKKLKELDATGIVRSSGGARRTYLGVYELDGDTLKWCVNNTGKGRPSEFASRRGQFLLILKKQKP
jgi:uncharacterized protein (TIGR03067 family)